MAIRQEDLGAVWSIKTWLKQHKVSSKRASEDLGVSDTIIHVWDKNRRSPFAAWKACQQLYRTSDSLGSLPKLVRSAQPYKVTEAMWSHALRFDQQWQGTTFFVEPAGEPHKIEPPNLDAMEALEGATVTPIRKVASEPVSGELLAVLAAARPAAEPEVVEALLTILTNLKMQRDGLQTRVEQLERQLLEAGDAAQLRAQLDAAKREIEQYRALAESMTAPRTLEAAAVERTRDIIKRRAPGLLEELSRLPQTA